MDHQGIPSSCGAATAVTTSLFEIEVRRFFGNTFAINPKFTRDLENDVLLTDPRIRLTRPSILCRMSAFHGH